MGYISHLYNVKKFLNPAMYIRKRYAHKNVLVTQKIYFLANIKEE